MLKRLSLLACVAGTWSVSCTQRAHVSPCVSLLAASDSVVVSNRVVDSAGGNRSLAKWTVSRAPLGTSGSGVIAVSWDAPPSGVLLRTSCSNAVDAIVESGHIDSLKVVRLGSEIPELVLASYSQGGATAFEGRGLAMFTEDSLRLVWVGETFEGNYGIPNGTVDSATIAVDSSGIIRHVWSWKLRLVAGRYEPVGPRVERVERYTWSPVKRRFEAISGISTTGR